ncbi:MAG: glycosyltransferase family 9 protein [Gemmatimonadota bacterium]|nr:glycosyltransferase family 9 protein [Gemmatimonadota bacterium]
MTRPSVPLDRVGIVMMSAIGGAVHVLPVITALKRARPESRISWVLQPGPAALVRGHPDVDDIILFDRERGHRAFLDVRRELAAHRFDAVLTLQTYFKAGLVTSFAHAPVKLGFDRARARDLSWLFTTHRVPARPTAHIQDEYFELIEHLGVPHEPVTWNLGPWPHEQEERRSLAHRFDRPLAALVIGSSRPEKDWPAERWATVCDELYTDYGMQPVLAGGRSPREAAAERVIMQRARHRPVSMLDSGLRPLVGILDASALVISLDTGPLHMAVALDRPIISLIGYTDPRRTGPYRRFHDLVIDAFHDPGGDGPILRTSRAGRMSRISVEQVLEKVAVWRERYAR